MIKKQILIFLVLTFALTWGIEFWLMANGGLTNPNISLLLMLVMLIPALCSLLTRLITREGFRNMALRVTWKSGKKAWLLSWFGPAVPIIIGTVLFFVIFPARFDSKFSIMQEALMGMQQSESTEAAGITPNSLFVAILSQIAIGVVLSPAINIIPSLGEELGWRGYLLPKLTALKGRKFATLATGLIWGLWHAPIIAQGYNYGDDYAGAPLWGILGMIIFCVCFGSFLAWLTYSTKSALPAALAHGGLNGFASIGFYFHLGEINPFIGPAPTGIIGGIAFIAVAVWCFMHLGEEPTPVEEEVN